MKRVKQIQWCGHNVKESIFVREQTNWPYLSGKKQNVYVNFFPEFNILIFV